MKIQKSTAEKLTITGVENLDPVAVIVEDFGPGQGKITITCFGDAWSHYWSHMGEDNKLADFFCGCDEHYLAKKLKSGINSKIDDDDDEALEKLLKVKIIEGRKDDSFNKNQARDLWDRTKCVEASNPSAHSDLLYDVLGDEWWCCTPKKPNPGYEYLCRIIKTVQAAMKMDATAAVEPS